jgi:putative tryptophan/tyrosine transport system substrate-binding protein
LNRRDFITLLGGAAATWPLAARAQQAGKLPVIGYLYAGSAEPTAYLLAAFRKGLSETGYVEGQNVAIEYRFAQNDNDRLPELAADLVRRQVTLIATPGSTPAAIVAKAATATIPVIFGIGNDPVQSGLVASLNQPGGNVTGVSSMNVELGAKRLGLLHELLPGSARFAALVNPNNPIGSGDVQAAASAIGRRIEVLPASTNRDIDIAFASLVQKRIDALLVIPDALFTVRRLQLVGLTLRHAVPAIFPNREDASAGGLMSYGSSFTELFRQTGIYASRILKGEQPADVPVLRASKFEFVINLQTAKTLGIEIPPTLLALADEMIE